MGDVNKGELYGGGVVFYVYKTAGVEHGLICAVEDQGTSIVWSDLDTTLIGATAQSAWDGLSNSNAIATYGTSTVSAAKLCLDYTNTDTGTGVYSDWYLPSKRELSLMYTNAFIIEKALSPSSGFASSAYWSSTEFNYGNAWYQLCRVGTAHRNKPWLDMWGMQCLPANWRLFWRAVPALHPYRILLSQRLCLSLRSLRLCVRQLCSV